MFKKKTSMQETCPTTVVTSYCCVTDHCKIRCWKQHPFVPLQSFRSEVQHCIGGLSVQNITRKKSQGHLAAFSPGARGLLDHGTGNKIYACCYFWDSLHPVSFNRARDTELNLYPRQRSNLAWRSRSGAKAQAST